MSVTLTTNAPLGVTAAKAFTPDTDTVIATASSVTAGSNDASFYTVVFATLADGQYRIVYYEGTDPVASEDVTVGDGAISIDDIDPSDPGKRTGYYVCYDENGVVESGVEVQCWCYYAPSTGLALDSAVRTETSDVDGLVQFTNMIVGAKYKFRRGDWAESKAVSVTVESGSGAFALDSVVGRDA